MLSNPSRKEMIVFDHRKQTWVMHHLNAIKLNVLATLPLSTAIPLMNRSPLLVLNRQR